MPWLDDDDTDWLLFFLVDVDVLADGDELLEVGPARGGIRTLSRSDGGAAGAGGSTSTRCEQVHGGRSSSVAASSSSGSARGSRYRKCLCEDIATAAPTALAFSLARAFCSSCLQRRGRHCLERGMMAMQGMSTGNK